MKSIRTLISQNGKFTNFLDPTYLTTKIIYDRIITGSKSLPSREEALWVILDEIYNRIEYQSDLEQYGGKIPEEFSGPDETLRKGKGDCEDMAFTAAAMCASLPTYLRPEIIRVTIGFVKPPFFPLQMPVELHAWTEVQTGGGWYILETTANELLVAPDGRYVPFLSIYPTKIMFHEYKWF